MHIASRLRHYNPKMENLGRTEVAPVGVLGDEGACAICLPSDRLDDLCLD